MGETARHEENNSMTSPTSVDIAGIADRYVAVWNEPDASSRGHLVGTLWSEEGIEFTEKNEYRGHGAIERRVADAYEQFVEGGRFVFSLGTPPAGHHDTITFTVEMTPAAGGPPEWSGTVFATFDEKGLIREDYQFGRYLK
jgi:hypothetical protein